MRGFGLSAGAVLPDYRFIPDGLAWMGEATNTDFRPAAPPSAWWCVDPPDRSSAIRVGGVLREGLPGGGQ